MQHQSPGQTEPGTPPQKRIARMLRSAMEAVILAMAVLAPWAFASVHPASVFLLYCGLSATLILWSTAILVDGRVTVSRCPVLLCLGGMVALGVWQVIPFTPSALATISPGTAAWRSELYPRELESLIGEEAVYPPGSTISLDPNATRDRIVQLLAVFALFAAVRYSVASPDSFRRFAIVCTINGALLSFFALAQRFSAPHHTIFWSYTTRGDPYGPFICKNNFPDYANVCLGLGVGLMLQTPGLLNRVTRFGDRLIALGQNCVTLWMVSAVGVMVTAILFSLSRGGMMGLAVGTLFFLLLAVHARKFTNSVGLIGAVSVLALGSTAWFGADAISQRLATLTDRDPDEGRREVWTRTLPLVGRFPLWGTGYGTFLSIEPLSFQAGDDPLLVDWEHAHNDYLETAIEGGTIGLLILLLGLVLTYRSGLRALTRLRDHPNTLLVLGGLSGLTAVAVHNIADFGMHVPAVVVLLTVLIGHITAHEDGLPRQTATRWLVVPIIATCWIVALILPIDGWLRERTEFFRLASIRAGNRLAPGEREPVIRYLRSAAEFEPENSEIRARLAEAEYEEFQTHSGQPGIPSSMRNELERLYLRPALRDYLRLRVSNPLLAQSHARLAGNRQFLHHPDSVSNYLERATRLRPTDETLWYLTGLEHLALNDPNRAWEDWQRSLLCSEQHLSSILPAAIARLGAVEVVDRVLPPNPALLLQAAQRPPLDLNRSDRRAFAVRALERMAEQPLSKKDDWYARAWLLREIGQTTAAIEAYECALRKSPDSLDWRFEFAELLFETGDLAEAERQLRKVLQAQPDRDGARELYASIVRTKSRTQ